jgi:hypothetical protein
MRSDEYWRGSIPVLLAARHRCTELAQRAVRFCVGARARRIVGEIDGFERNGSGRKTGR